MMTFPARWTNRFRVVLSQLLLFAGVVYFLFRWAEEDRVLYLVLAGITGTTFCVLALLYFTKTARIARRMSSVIIIAMTFCFVIVGYLFRGHIDHVIQEADLSANLDRLASYRANLNNRFMKHTEQGEFLRKRLTAEPFWRQPGILAEFLRHHSEDYFSVYLLDDQGVSLLSEPISTGYKENYPVRNLPNPAFVEPSFQPISDGNQAPVWHTLKYFIPLETAEGQKRYILLYIRTNAWLLEIKQSMPGVSVFLLHDNEIIATNEKQWNENIIRGIKNEGYGRNSVEQIFFARYPLRSENWSVVFLQAWNTAFPNMAYAESALIRVLIFSAVLGFLTGVLLSWYLSRTILLPLSRLAGDVQIVASGDQTHTLRESSSDPQDELGALHHAIANMVKSLKESTIQTESVQRAWSDVQSELETQSDVVKKIQGGTLRSSPLITRGLTINGRLVIAQEHNGKFYDITEPQPGFVAFAIADPAGKGAIGSFYAALMKGLLSAYWKRSDLLLQDPLRWMSELETDFMKHRDTDTRTIALGVGIINTHDHRVRLINAGSEYPVLQKKDQTQSIAIRGRALGMPQWLGSFETTTFVLATGETMFLHSNGISPDTMTDGSEKIQNTAMDSKQGDAVILKIARCESVKENFIFTPGPDVEFDTENKIQTMMANRGFESEKIKSMLSACRETITYAARSTKLSELKKSIHVETEAWDDGVEVRITDQNNNSHWNKARISEGSDQAEGKAVRAWRIGAIQKLVDEVIVEQTANKTTIVLRSMK